MKTRDERGVISTEAAVIFPVLLFLALFAVFAGRVSRQNTSVQSAADAAARAASLHLDAGSAQVAATAAAQANAGNCASITVLDFSFPTVSAFSPGVVQLRVTCTIDNTAFGLGARTAEAVGVATVEFWRPEG